MAFSKNNDNFYTFEGKWNNFCSKYIVDSKKISLNVCTDWIVNFLTQTTQLSNIILPSIIDSRFLFDNKISKKEKKRFYKKINSLSEGDYRLLIRLIVFDYFNQDRPLIREVINKEFPNDELETAVFTFYLCSDSDKKLLNNFILKANSYYPTFLLLEKLHFEEFSKDERIVEFCEYIKEQLYDQFDTSFLNFYNKTQSEA